MKSAHDNSSPNDVAKVLAQSGLLTSSQAELARRRASRQKSLLHRAILDLGYTSEDAVYRALAQVNGVPYIQLDAVAAAPELYRNVPIKVVLHYKVFPLEEDATGLKLAFAEMPGRSVLANLRLVLGKRPRVSIMAPSALRIVIERYYGLGAATVQQLRDDRGLGAADETLTFENVDAAVTDSNDQDEASISKLVTQLLFEALRLGATDIHIEPYQDRIRLRYRIDGILRDIPVPAGLQALYGSIVSRLKVMAGLNIAERRLPHDGRIAMRHGEQLYDLRVSILPTRLGEAVCLRVLGRGDLMFEFDRLGMFERQQVILESLMGLSQGMILLTGPTGSGKTTTLYTALQRSRDEGRKVITVEDPVEYQMEGISQIQIRPEIGLSFSAGLRSILRHDPDVVLVGEIRDRETAEIAVRSAQTGHLVLSTLHTNDSVSAVVRLIEMGIEPFLVASSLVCSIAQRLVRRNCRSCAVEDSIHSEKLKREMALSLGLELSEVRAKKGTGCFECDNLGYRGREALYEIFTVNDAIADIIQPGLSLYALREAARSNGWRPLREAGWEKVQAGILSIEELERVTRRVDDILGHRAK